MYNFQFDSKLVIEEVQWAPLTYRRPRKAGCNARLGVHGWGGEVPIARIKIGGKFGFGWSRCTEKFAQTILGKPIADMFLPNGLLKKEYQSIEFPLLDWMGQYFTQPVFELVAKDRNKIDVQNYAVPVYDTTIYFDELHIQDHKEAANFICEEVDFGLENGHKNFKVKIGRSGMWMDIQEGMRRDIEIINAIRNRIGSIGKLMVDANNGYNLNLTKYFLEGTKEAGLFWLEEAFHEDNELYCRLRDWMKEKELKILIADGEGLASSAIEDWAKQGIIDVLQYDLKGYGFFNWIQLGNSLDKYNVKIAPHNYGGFYGNYAQTHFTAAVDNFVFAEWDQATVEEIDTSAYQIEDGVVKVPYLTGFGLGLDVEKFKQILQLKGWNQSLR